MLIPIFLPLFFMGNCDHGVQFQQLTLEEALTLAKTENKMVLIDFWADG